MKYISTRGGAAPVGFVDALLAGLAGDGGLYVPESWPTLTEDEIADFAGRPYADVAAKIMQPFVGDAIDEDTFKDIVADAYAGFDHLSVAPLVQLGANDWLMELFRGPTFAFKDVALQLLGGLFEHALQVRDRHVTIIGATSGDTGSAAIEAIRGKERARVVILHPKGRTSDIQRKQMTTVQEDNVLNIAVEGTFDDCQALVKAMFADKPFAAEVGMSGVNSINWARIMAQVVYYFTSAVALGAPYRPVSFSVPTGNFGDIFAGYVAGEMGLPIDRLMIATNRNDILARTLKTGRYEVSGVSPTLSPSMDIQVSSNFERLLFDATGRDSDAVRAMMEGLRQAGSFTVPEAAHAHMREVFDAEKVEEDETLATIEKVFHDTGMIIDPHTAVGVAAAQRSRIDSTTPWITLATAHPAKFPDAVEEALGFVPPMPERLAKVLEGEERFDTLANDITAIEDRIRTFIEVTA